MKMYISILLICCNQVFGQLLQTSNLPILIIETSTEIVDEPKVPGSLKVLWNEDGSINSITDDPHTDIDIGVELRGQSSQSLFDKKGYGFESRDSQGENLNISLINLPEENDWVIHSPFSDKSLIRNVFAYGIAEQIMDYAPRTQLCELIVNSDYKGVVVLTEKIKRDKNRVDISKLTPDENEGDDLTGGYMFRFDKTDSDEEVAWVSPFRPLAGSWQETRFVYSYPDRDDISDTQFDYIVQWMDNFESILRSRQYTDSLDGYRKYIDVESFIDFMLHTELTKNVDGYRLSTYMYKHKDSKGGKLHMGPVWDHNLALGNANYCDGAETTGWAYEFNEICSGDFWLVHFWWERLLTDPVFRGQFRQRWIDLRANEWSTENLMRFIDLNADNLSGPAQRNFERWPILGEWVWPNEFIGNNYQQEINYLKNWLRLRLQWLDVEIMQFSTSTENTRDTSAKVFPIPASSRLNIERSSNTVVDIIITDIYGRTVTQLNEYENNAVNIDALPSGTYVLQIIENNQFVSKTKFIKQ